MAADDNDEKSHALEALLKDSLHAMESMEEVDRVRKADDPQSEPGKNASERHAPREIDEISLFERIGELTGSAFRLARRTTDTSVKVGRALMRSQDQLRVMLAAGRSLRDLREVAGLTVSEMAEALDLRDKSVLEAAENGTATLSFELILRLAALLARNDPVPFILKYTRTYNPELWRVLDDWGVGRLPLQFEREREFINIYRRHDEARKLSDEGFARVLQFTRSAFEMSLHFVAEQEGALADARSERVDSEVPEPEMDNKTKANRTKGGRAGKADKS